MKINIHLGLPYIEASITYNSRHLTFKKIIIDTGSSSSIFKADNVSDLGILLEPEDSIHRISGVGGSEFVFTKQLDKLQIGTLSVEGFTVEIGAMDYGFEIDGIIDMDFLQKVRAVIDLEKLEIYSSL